MILGIVENYRNSLEISLGRFLDQLNFSRVEHFRSRNACIFCALVCTLQRSRESRGTEDCLYCGETNIPTITQQLEVDAYLFLATSLYFHSEKSEASRGLDPLFLDVYYRICYCVPSSQILGILSVCFVRVLSASCLFTRADVFDFEMDQEINCSLLKIQRWLLNNLQNM